MTAIAQRPLRAIQRASTVIARRDPGVRAGLERVAAQIAERLTQEHLVAVDRARTRREPPPRRRATRASRADFLGAALDDGAACRRAQDQLAPARAKFRKLRDDLAERLRLVADAVHVGRVVGGQPLEIEQPRVPVDGRQAVAELVRDPRGQLADLRQAVLQPQLLLELDDRR